MSVIVRFHLEFFLVLCLGFQPDEADSEQIVRRHSPIEDVDVFIQAFVRIQAAIVDPFANPDRNKVLRREKAIINREIGSGYDVDKEIPRTCRIGRFSKNRLDRQYVGNQLWYFGIGNLLASTVGPRGVIDTQVTLL